MDFDKPVVPTDPSGDLMVPRKGREDKPDPKTKLSSMSTTPVSAAPRKGKMDKVPGTRR